MHHSPARPCQPKLTFALILLLGWAVARLQGGTTAEVERQLQHLLDERQHREAVAYGEAQLKEVQPSAKIYRLLAESSYEADDGDGTRRYALKTLELDAGDELAARLYVSACRDQRLYDEGIKFGREWVEKNTKGTDIYKDIALLAHSADRLDDAKEFAAEAFRRKPENSRIAGVHFYLQCVAGDPLAAAAAAQAWAAKHTPDAYFWAQLGKGLSDAEKAKEALPILQRALAEGSADRGVVTEIMDCYRNLGDRAAAAKFIETYGTDHELFAGIWRTMGAMHYDAEAYGEALAAFQKAKKLDPDNASTMANMIFTLVELKRAREGIEEGQRWLNLEAGTATPGFHRAMGNAYFARERWMEAEPHYREAVRLDPTRIHDVRELVVVLDKLHRTGEAVALGRHWQAGHPDIKDNGLEEALARMEKSLREQKAGDAATAG